MRGLHAYQGVYTGQEILLLQSGMGMENAQRAVKYVDHPHAHDSGGLSGLLFLGFGGALTPGASIGDLIFCQKLFCNDVAYASQPYESDRHLLVMAQAAMKGSPVRWVIGTSLTVNQPATKPEVKANLNAHYHAQVVDMESYWVACSAVELGIPFLAVRAISDTSDELLPPFERFINARGDWLWKEALRYFWTRPGDLAAIPRIFRNSRLAGKNLAFFFRTFIPQIGKLTLPAR